MGQIISKGKIQETRPCMDCDIEYIKLFNVDNNGNPIQVCFKCLKKRGLVI